jgi:outer membrane biosynthesis protein TonB
MIPRTLVPVQLMPPPATTDGRRRTWTFLDERLVIPAQLPVKPFDLESNIPSHVPLEVLGERILIPRESTTGPLELPSPGETFLPTEADERMAVPVDARPLGLLAPERLPFGRLQLEDLVEPDVFTTGEVHLLPRAVGEMPRDWSWIVPVGTLVLHAALVLSMIATSVLFPHRAATQEEIDLAARNLGIIYLPDSMFSPPKTPPRPQPPSDKLRIDPRMIRKLAPEVMPSPMPGAPTPPAIVAPAAPRELPSAPVAQGSPDRPQDAVRMETPKPVPDGPNPSLKLPRVSPGRDLDESMRGAARRGGTQDGAFDGPIPGGHRGGPGGSPGGGGGQGYLGGAVQMLSPDEGVDFSSYLARVLASVKRNWYAVIPESARLGDKGRVVIDFRILRNGNVPLPEPLLRATSGKEPLDRAALSSIRASSPFEPLPPAFSGPYIELRFIFLYNLPLDAQ